jgi:hypothetical protein
MVSSRFPHGIRTASIISGARCLYGVSLLLCSRPVARIAGAPGDAGVVRLLGVRHVLQAAFTASGGDPERRLRDGVVVDVAHSLSMVAVAVISPSRRRAAGLSAVSAAGWALAGLRVASASRPPPQPISQPRGR